jgi:hypothetical protein
VGASILQFDATGEPEFLALGRKHTVDVMASHVSHIGVHDHGFNNVSTYGNLLRLAHEGRIDASDWERNFHALALKVSGAVQAARWTRTQDGAGFIYSFNGPHSLFSDTIRSLRALALAHRLGHVLMGERDQKISLLGRLVDHALVTAQYNVYYGKGRDAYDLRGRVVHESIFNTNDGHYRCPSTQQGYALLDLDPRAGLDHARLRRGAGAVRDHLRGRAGARSEEGRPGPADGGGGRATCDFWIDEGTASTASLQGHRRPQPGQAGGLEGARPPIPSTSTSRSTARPRHRRPGPPAPRPLPARAGRTLAPRYWQAGLTVAHALFGEPYLSTRADHQGLLLHSDYPHRPNGWDARPRGARRCPAASPSMWGDYHGRELAALPAADHQPRVPYHQLLLGVSVTPPSTITDLSKLCIHTITTKPWKLEEAVPATPRRRRRHHRLAPGLAGPLARGGRRADPAAGLKIVSPVPGRLLPGA